MNAAELSKILEEHKLWITSLGQEGSKANLYNANLCNADLCNADLYNADLCNADLRNADLRNANLRNANLCNADLYNADLYNADLCNADLYNADLPDLTFVIMGEEYPITITNGEYVRAGCQHHTVEEWRNFSKQEIAEMDGRDALKFYPRLLDIIDFYLGKGSRPDWLTSKEYAKEV
ncbi:pentapeptide repeat-containing protein [Salmonella enterica]|nr:pentapeptide repeat-containing protein [Salmonella enterica]